MAARRRDFVAQLRDPAGRPATVVLILAIGVVYLLQMFPRVADALYCGSDPSLAFEAWRPLLYFSTSGNVLSMLFAMIGLYLIGGPLEESMGMGFIALFWLCGLGGAVGIILAGPAFAIGGSGMALVGLIAASAVFKHRQFDDIRPDLIFLAIVVAFDIVLSTSQWMGDLTGMAAGASCGWLYAYAAPAQRRRRMIVGCAVLAAVCMAVIMARWIVLARAA